MLYLTGSEVPYKVSLQQVNRSAVFLQVLISPLGRSTKLETGQNGRGGDLHSVVGSKSTLARGTGRLKPEMIEIHLPQPPKPTHHRL